MLGGVSRVISAKGKGTRIEITVPAEETQPRPPVGACSGPYWSTAELIVKRTPPCRRLNVCLLMITRCSARVYAALLESESDFEVVGESPDGGDAVEKARELRPDVVLMDIGMPGLSSFESARQIKKNRRGNQDPVPHHV